MIPAIYRNYKFILTGEAMRAFELGLIGAAVAAIGPIGSFTDVKTYVVGAVIAGLNFAVSFAKGKLKPTVEL